MEQADIMKNIFFLTLASFLAFFNYCYTQSPLQKDLRIQLIDSLILEENQKENFNGNVLIAEHGRILYTKAFGFSNSARKPLEPNHKFLIGSIQKEIPAIAVMQLEEKGLLQLDDKLSGYLHELPEWANQISIYNLLQYSSGLPKINWQSHQEISPEVLFEDLLNLKELAFPAGEGYLYTNYSPFLLSRVVEEVTGVSFQEYVQRNIFEVAGLYHSEYMKQYPFQNHHSIAQALSREYKEEYPPFLIKEPLFLYATTIEDLFYLQENLHTNKLISEESLEVLAIPTAYKYDNKQSALGNIRIKNNRIVEHVHHGSSGNYESLMSRYNEDGLTIILMTNRKRQNLFELNKKIKNVMTPD